MRTSAAVLCVAMLLVPAASRADEDSAEVAWGDAAPECEPEQAWALTRSWLEAFDAGRARDLAAMTPRGVTIAVDVVPSYAGRACRRLDGKRVKGRAALRRLTRCFARMVDPAYRVEPTEFRASPLTVVWVSGTGADCDLGDHVVFELGERDGALVIRQVSFVSTHCTDG
jgi:hypothetical protein